MTVQAQDALADLARSSLADVAAAGSVGEVVSVEDREDGVTDVAFAAALPGYVGWRWTVSIARIDDAEPTVLEVGLLPGEGALVAPPWVPWAERLAEYRRLHPDEPIEDGAEDADEVDDGEDVEDPDEDADSLDDADELDGVDFELPEDSDDGLGDDADDAGDGDRVDDEASDAPGRTGPLDED